jgi:hypothetical protein
MFMKSLKILLFVSFICLSGCMRLRQIRYEPAPNSYYLNPAKDLNRLGKVALVELTSQSVLPALSMNITESLFQEIQKEQLFSLITIQQDDPAWKSLQLNNDGNYSFEELALIRSILRCDGILMGTITVFEPYPHLTIGLRLRLIDLEDGELVWAMEQVWDTTDKTTQKRIEDYYSPKRIILKDEDLRGQLGSVSTLKFLKFVAHEITMTLHAGR